MRLLPLAILVLMVLTTIFVVRAVRASRQKRALDKGWFAQQMDIGEETVIQLGRYGHRPRIEAKIRFDDPDYSNKVIEAYATAQTKADDRNSTIKALA